ncbi:50S ribosomal protein L6 [Candidatus Beckwithbacteria bacterium RBG_13_42_9]|uniref:Large ribosomal subunit protein uL6 n=1 Tax=Candidatus Beckwithbacteria bacterium RBG_13_42_9 TaxID=1797457 RepID=A0A1F5E984_9BACT|nr:MAG: 50S ribosomal protein L6 [Candidatus Beckwithbacteria bacterium RBG_13_42_9]
MSRVGKQILAIPQGLTVKVEGKIVTVTGPKGTLSLKLNPEVTVEVKNSLLEVKAKGNSKYVQSLHGLIRSLLANMVKGLTKGFEKRLELVGTGYRVQPQGKGLKFSLGLSHEVNFEPPEGVTLTVEGQNKIVVSGADSRLVGQIGANIRKLRPPEPYKGKGIRYAGEVIRKKAGKQVKAAE